jgi:two-component system phosphate regulon sensor histidine kinase PhoR
VIAVAAAAGVLIGYVALANPSRSLAAVSDAADRVAAGELGQRVAMRSRATADLTDAFNSMSGRVQDLVEGVAAERGRLEAVFDASADAMIAVSRDTVVRLLNTAAAGLFEVDRAHAVGRPFIETARDYELDALVRRAIALPANGDANVINFGRHRIPLRAVAVPIRHGGDWAVLLMLSDLTDVQRVDQVRRDFLTNVSHELRTPLASIRAMVETLEDGGLDDREDAEAFLARIHQQVDRLTALVSELLDLSRIESGAVELRPEPIDAAGLIAEAASLLRTRAESEDVTIVCRDAYGPIVEGDRTSLLRVVSNLLDNAIKFSPRGGEVRAEARDEGELVALSVQNDGEGIPETDLPRVFERFYKGDHSRSQGGVGLGLAIVKHVVRAHGGTAEAMSEPGKGATFTVRLPKTFVGAQRGKPRAGG